jgi:hypothetical protein
VGIHSVPSRFNKTCGANSGVGKTSFAKAHGNYPLIVSTLDDLKKITPDKTDLLVFDDMEFSEWMPLARESD